jgi:hypothetical protein
MIFKQCQDMQWGGSGLGPAAADVDFDLMGDYELLRKK